MSQNFNDKKDLPLPVYTRRPMPADLTQRLEWAKVVVSVDSEPDNIGIAAHVRLLTETERLEKELNNATISCQSVLEAWNKEIAKREQAERERDAMLSVVESAKKVAIRWELHGFAGGDERLIDSLCEAVRALKGETNE